MGPDPLGERPVAADALQAARELAGSSLEQGRPRRRRDVGAEASTRVALKELEAEPAGVERLDAADELKALDLTAADRAVPDHGERLGGPARGEPRFDLLARDPPRRVQLAILLVWQVAPTAEHPAALRDRLVEGQVLEAVERVVVDEGPDRPLGGQDVGEVIHLVPEVVARLFGRGDGHGYSNGTAMRWSVASMRSSRRLG